MSQGWQVSVLGDKSSSASLGDRGGRQCGSRWPPCGPGRPSLDHGSVIPGILAPLLPELPEPQFPGGHDPMTFHSHHITRHSDEAKGIGTHRSLQQSFHSDVVDPF